MRIREFIWPQDRINQIDRHDSVYLMLDRAFWHFTDRGYEGEIGPYVRDVRLAVSRDGETFERAGNRAAFLRPGPAGRFDSKQVWALPNPV